MKTDGNVIYPQFGRVRDPAPMLSFSLRCQLLFTDEHLAVMRLTYDIGGKEFIQHVMTGLGVNA